MSIYSTDTNHFEIVKGLRLAGFDVMDNADSGNGRLDIIVTKNPAQTVCIEIKYGPKAEFKRSQLEFLANWKGYCGYVTVYEAALLVATDPAKYALSSALKLKIQQWLYRNPNKKRVLVSTFEKEAFGIIR